MTIEQLLVQIRGQPESIEFDEVIATINSNYDYTACAFRNGDSNNTAGSNEGSCKIFAFAQLNKLSKDETLACFGKYYREDVLTNPDGHDHANIRNFMRHGWDAINFEAPALSAKT